MDRQLQPLPAEGEDVNYLPATDCMACLTSGINLAFTLYDTEWRRGVLSSFEEDKAPEDFGTSRHVAGE